MQINTHSPAYCFLRMKPVWMGLTRPRMACPHSPLQAHSSSLLCCLISLIQLQWPSFSSLTTPGPICPRAFLHAVSSAENTLFPPCPLRNDFLTPYVGSGSLVESSLLTLYFSIKAFTMREIVVIS